MTGTRTVSTVKQIHVDVDKCNGCLSCELSCSAAHAIPAYSSVNPARSRITVVIDEVNDVYVPIRAGNCAPAECAGRNRYVIGGKEYAACSFCPAPCPSRSRFTEPDSGLPLKCDMCESLDLDEPMCVQVCHPGALSYEKRQVELADAPEPEQRGEAEIGLEALVRRHGLRAVAGAVARRAR